VSDTTVTVLVDAENVRRSTWPNIDEDDLVERCARWARREGVDVVLVFDGRAPAAREPCDVVGSRSESADDWIVREATRLTAAGTRYRVVTSDRELRERAGAGAESVVGGGSFARTLLSA